MCNFGTEDAVVHHQHLQLGHVIDDEAFEVSLVLAAMAVGGLGAVSDRGHQILSLESSADARVNTLGLSP